MRLAWVTDIHLNFLKPHEHRRFLDALAATDAAALLVGGDIGEADSVGTYLAEMAVVFQRPVYFVLGNHDFYGGSIAAVRRAMTELCRREPWLQYLPESGVVELTPTTGLVGHDGWGDGRNGNYATTPVALNDHRLIAELTAVSRPVLLERLRRLGDEAAACLRPVLADALRRYPRLFVLTHVPPFPEACWYQGQAGDADWTPFFSCKAVGDLLLDLLRTHPDRHVTVLCGHAHGAGAVQMLPNLLVLTGEAEYGVPQIQRVFEVG
ncbi:metallophosphoesterase [Nitrospira sp. Kam-Ns4a]